MTALEYEVSIRVALGRGVMKYRRAPYRTPSRDPCGMSWRSA